jgi:outer membrane protein
MTALLLIFTVFLTAQPEISLYRELDLSGWVAVAYEHSPAISLADASLLSARAGLTGNRAFLWPSLTASAGASKMWSGTPLSGGGTVDDENVSYSAGVVLSQELLQSGGQNWLYMEASELSVMAAESDHDEAVLNVTMDVISAYYGVLESIELKKASEAAHERSMSQLERTEALYRIGAVTTLELLQIQVQESSDRLAVSRKEQSLFTAYSNLYNAAGVGLEGENLRINPNAVLEPLPLEAARLISLDYSGNPGLRAASIRVRSADVQLRASGRALWPSLRASAGWSWSDNTLDDIDRMFDSDGYHVGLNLSWNVFDGFLRESRVKSARASILVSQATLESLENTISSSVEALWNTLNIDIQYYNDSKLMLEQAQEQYRLSAMSYEMGALSLLDLLNAQSDLALAEANLVSARVAALTSEASLLIQLGRMPRVGE